MKYLFFDDAVIERKAGLERRWHRAEKHGHPMLEPEMPWEGKRLTSGIPPEYDPERGVWRLWYRGGGRALYAESEDGLNWTRPNLGLVAYEGDIANNIIDLGFKPRSGKESSISPVKNPDPDDPHPYKGLVRIDNRLRPLQSRDGLSWQRIEGTGAHSGDAFTLYFDDIEGRYVSAGKLPYGRHYPVAYYKRTVGIATSEDLLNWTAPEMVMHGDELDQQLGIERVQKFRNDPSFRPLVIWKPEQFRSDVYVLPIFTYEGLYMGLPVIFNQTGRYYLTGEKWDGLFTNEDGYLHTQIAFSRDLYDWQRPNRLPFLDISPQGHPNLYDYGGVYCAPPVLRDGELWFYYVGRRSTHVKLDVTEMVYGPDEVKKPDMSLFLARLRQDGFVSLEAGDKEGFVLTRPLTVDGSRLMVNADAAEGALWAELIDAQSGLVIEGYAATDRKPAGCWRFDEDRELEDNSLAFSEDTLTGQLRWRGVGDVSALKGREVRIRFFLRNAQLYSFWFGV